MFLSSAETAWPAGCLFIGDCLGQRYLRVVSMFLWDLPFSEEVFTPFVSGNRSLSCCTSTPVPRSFVCFFFVTPSLGGHKLGDRHASSALLFLSFPLARS